MITGTSLPGATVLTLVAGAIFGLVNALILVSFASTVGASIAFLVSRYLFRDAVQSRFGTSLKAINDGIDKDIVAPLENYYLKLPDGGRGAIHNFFVNLGYPTTFINQFLQGKIERGFEDTMRILRGPG